MRLLGTVAVAFALALPASALAAWEPAQQIPAEPARGLEIGLDGRGDGILAWTEYPAGGGGVLHVGAAPARRRVRRTAGALPARPGRARVRARPRHPAGERRWPGARAASRAATCS